MESVASCLMGVVGIGKIIAFFGRLCDFCEIAAGLGIEPKLEASKAPVLPLDDPAMGARTLSNSLFL